METSFIGKSSLNVNGTIMRDTYIIDAIQCLILLTKIILQPGFNYMICNVCMGYIYSMSSLRNNS